MSHAVEGGLKDMVDGCVVDVRYLNERIKDNKNKMKNKRIMDY